MACKNANNNQITTINMAAEAVESVLPESQKEEIETAVSRLLFGVDSETAAQDLLQNNITKFEWVIRNKLYPNFWGRNISGENCLSKEEIEFLHEKGCKIAAVYSGAETKDTEEQGKIIARKIDIRALELDIPENTAVFLEIKENENVSRDYMRGFAETLSAEGFVPGFKVSTDAAYPFDREYSRGMQTDREIFNKCLIWATAPSLKEYERVTTTHLIHPDNWIPYAPSGITREDIAIWQYGKDCHPIRNDAGSETTFHVNLVRNEKIILENMF